MANITLTNEQQQALSSSSSKTKKTKDHKLNYILPDGKQRNLGYTNIWARYPDEDIEKLNQILQSVNLILIPADQEAPSVSMFD